MKMLTFTDKETDLQSCLSVTVQAENFRDKVWRRRLRWFEHVQRRGSGHTGQKMLKMQQLGNR